MIYQLTPNLGREDEKDELALAIDLLEEYENGGAGFDGESYCKIYSAPPYIIVAHSNNDVPYIDAYLEADITRAYKMATAWHDAADMNDEEREYDDRADAFGCILQDIEEKSV